MLNSNYPTNQSKSYRSTRRKAFFSNELKKALLLAYCEARRQQTYVNIDFLLYGLLAQQRSLSSRLFSLIASQFRNNEKLTAQLLSTRLQKINQDKLSIRQFTEFSTELINESKKTPWLTSEAKQIIRSAINNSFQTQRKVVVVTTNHLLFALLNRENIRASLRSIVD